MEDVLTKKEQKKLVKLGKDIINHLSCDINDTGMPCRTDRFKALELMQEYLLINNSNS